MHVAIFSGGRGSSSLVRAVKNFSNIKVSIIVNAYDNGLSTGALRSSLNILGISDIRKTIGLLSMNNGIRSLFEKRVSITSDINFTKLFYDSLRECDFNNSVKGQQFIEKLVSSSIELLEGHKLPSDEYAFGNLLMSSIFKQKDINSGLRQLLRALDIKDDVILNSYDNLFLCAISTSGHLLLDEAVIVGGRSSVSIDDIYLLRRENVLEIKKKSESISLSSARSFLCENSIIPSATEGSLKALLECNLVIFAPGTPHSSLYPTYMTSKFGTLLDTLPKAKILVCNIGADYETPSYKVSDYVLSTKKYFMKSGLLSENNLITHVFVNKSTITNQNEVVFDDHNNVFKGLDVRHCDLKLDGQPGIHSEAKLFFALKPFMTV